jgi:hypothetical protein
VPGSGSIGTAGSFGAGEVGGSFGAGTFSSSGVISVSIVRTRSGSLVVGLACLAGAVVLGLFRGVLEDAARSVLVAVACVLDEFALRFLEALRLALAGFGEWPVGLVLGSVT